MNPPFFSPQLIDAATAAQTRASQEALLELVSFEDDYALDYPERYLLAAAYSTHPSESLIRDLMVANLKSINTFYFVLGYILFSAKLVHEDSL